MNEPALSTRRGWSPETIVVVGDDGTTSGERALARAIDLACTLGSRVVIADVATPQPLQTTPGAFGYGVSFR